MRKYAKGRQCSLLRRAVLLNTLLKYTHYQEEWNTRRSTLSLVAKSTDCAKISLQTKKSHLLFFSISAYLGPRWSKSNKGNFFFIFSRCTHRQLQPLARRTQERCVRWLAPNWAHRLWSHSIPRQKPYLYCLLGQLQPGAHTLLRAALSHEPKPEPPTPPREPTGPFSETHKGQTGEP